MVPVKFSFGSGQLFCRWAWLSRGMASMEEMIEVNPDCNLTEKTLEVEMQRCEKEVQEEPWHA